MFNKFWKRTPSTSLCADESCIYGRQRDKEAFLELILSSEAFGNCGGSVFAIVGMAGVGKTTLAQLVYNDHRVMNSFDFQRWVFVSDNFDVVEIAANGRGYVNALQDGSSWEMEAQFDFSPGCNWLHLHYLCGCCNHEITFATTLLLWLLSLETLRTSSSRQVSSIQLARTKMAFPHNEVELSIVGAATSYVNNVRNTITALVLFLVQLHSSFFEDMK
ncbi:hypothetical protein GH714_005370 [Hevea brasiliensis]|uniref:NB-ARC domain-containing protein n=1 Tax=Hevea brasiliensis TaxID=3981 RepID=A0A6A6L2G5_HEVBR|nr:hypothetical protein GH714_005370 [Hevea brasiliensis]